jgi:hypothetical protein
MDSAFLTCEGNMDVKLGSGVVDSRRNIVIKANKREGWIGGDLQRSSEKRRSGEAKIVSQKK